MKIKIIIMMLTFLIVGCTNDTKETGKEDIHINTEEDVIKDQIVEVFRFENTSLVYENGTSTLETIVTNTSNIDQTIKEFHIIVKDKNDKEIITLIGFIGDTIKSGETKSISSNCYDDLTNAVSIEYKIIK